MRSLSYLALFLTLGSFVNLHKFYIGTTQMVYLSKEQTLQVVQRVFTDDLEKELAGELGRSIEIATKRTPKNINTLYQRYLNHHLKFIVDEDSRSFELVGVEQQGDQTVFYMEIHQLKKFKKFHFQNTLLMNVFDDQKHIVNTKINGEKRSFVLSLHKIKVAIL